MTTPLATLLLSSFFFVSSIAIVAPRHAGRTIAGAGILAAPWIDVRLSDVATVSDALLVLSVPLLLVSRQGGPGLRTFWTGPRSWLLRFSVLFLVGGVVGGLLNPGAGGAGYDVAVRFAISTSVVSIIVWLFAYNQRGWIFASYLFVLGATFSTIFGIIDSRVLSGTGRAVGLTGHPNHLGLSALLAIPLAVSLLRSSHRFVVWGSTFALPVLAIAVFSSGSRAALIGIAVWLAMLVAFSPRIRTLAATFIGLTLVAAAVIVPTAVSSGDSAISRLFAPTAGEGASTAARSDFYEQAVELIRQNPLVGQGFANALQYHSVPLQIVVVAGLMGVAALIFLGIGAVRLAREAARPQSSLTSRSCAAGVLGVMAMLIFSNQIFDRYLVLSLALMTLGIFGLAFDPDSEGSPTVEDRIPRAPSYR